MTIEEQVKQYADLDAKAKQIDDMKKPLNVAIKAYMRDNGIHEVAVDGIKAVFGKQERVSMNEAKLLEKVKGLGLTQAIKTIEVVDEDIINQMVYEGTLEPSLIEDCVETKVVETLTIRGGKKRK